MCCQHLCALCVRKWKVLLSILLRNKSFPDCLNMRLFPWILNIELFKQFDLPCTLCIINSFSTKSVSYWLGSHFHAACFLALSCRFSSRFHSFSFWRLWFLAIWSPSLCLLWCYHIAGPLLEAGLTCGAAWWLSTLVVFCLLICQARQHTVGLMLELTYN